VRSFAWTMLLMAAAVAAATVVIDVERNPVRRHPAARIATTGPQRIIVKLRAPGSAAGVAAVNAVAPAAGESGAAARLSALAVRTGLSLEGYRSITEDLQVMHVAGTGGGESAEELLARLRADPQVQYAELDQYRFVHSVPNDTLYSEQWYLMPPTSPMPSAIDAQTAWTTTTGSAGTVIADIDTGVRFDHPDLLSVSSGGRLLPGYCFISDAVIANNSSCPGPDASDPGDWVTQADLSTPECVNAGVTLTSVSSWHGTRVAGILAALSNNSTGIAGTTWSGKLLPVRAVGVCGGLDSDIITGMLWAAGIAVSGAPANTTPANVINLSLGGSGTCPQSYQDAVDQITARGVLIVASAGNESGPMDAPANCAGVAGIVGLRQAGTKVGYSSLGPQAALGAPAGNCINTPSNTAPCIDSLVTTTNLGAQGPGVNDYTGEYYCDQTTGSYANCPIGANQYRTYNLGTSFAAPQVAGIGALMRTVNAKLNSCQLIARLKEGALPYPQSSVGETTQPPLCPGADASTGECICTNDGQTCGAGMANAPGALAAALRPIAAVAVPAAVSAAQVVQLKATGSAAVSGHTISTFGWSNAGGLDITIQNANTSTASVTLPSCGLATVVLTVTDDAGRQDTAQVVISPTSVTTTAPASAGQTACSVTPPPVQVALCPASVSVQTGRTQSFAATLANTSDSSVVWQVNGIDGGDATVGTISSTGVYTAPASLPPSGTVTVTALSAADNSATASAKLTITSPAGSGGGGGALDWLTLLGAACAVALQSVRAARRSAATSASAWFATVVMCGRLTKPWIIPR
jgi:serine protease